MSLSRLISLRHDNSLTKLILDLSKKSPLHRIARITNVTSSPTLNPLYKPPWLQDLNSHPQFTSTKPPPKNWQAEYGEGLKRRIREVEESEEGLMMVQEGRLKERSGQEQGSDRERREDCLERGLGFGEKIQHLWWGIFCPCRDVEERIPSRQASCTTRKNHWGLPLESGEKTIRWRPNIPPSGALPTYSNPARLSSNSREIQRSLVGSPSSAQCTASTLITTFTSTSLIETGIVSAVMWPPNPMAVENTSSSALYMLMNTESSSLPSQDFMNPWASLALTRGSLPWWNSPNWLELSRAMADLTPLLPYHLSHQRWTLQTLQTKSLLTKPLHFVYYLKSHPYYPYIPTYHTASLS